MLFRSDAIAARQHNVEEDDVGLRLSEDPQCGVTVSAEHGFEAFGAQDDTQHLGQGRVVINHQDAVRHGDIMSSPTV